MTRAEIKRNIRLRLAESPDDLREPLLLDEIVRIACNDVAQRTDCYQTSFTLDIDGSPTALGLFCLPGDLYKIKGVRVTLSDGSYRILTQRNGQFVTRTWMNQYIPTWATSPESGDPRYLVLERPEAQLYPFPNYDSTGGLILYGFARPGDAWTSSAAAESDACPLPYYAHTAVELRGAYLRAMQFPSKDNMFRLPLLEREYEREIGIVARHASQEHSDASIYRGEI